MNKKVEPAHKKIEVQVKKSVIDLAEDSNERKHWDINIPTKMNYKNKAVSSVQHANAKGVKATKPAAVTEKADRKTEADSGRTTARANINQIG